jgi:hypothetical protein
MSYTLQFLLYTSLFVSFFKLTSDLTRSIQCREYLYRKSFRKALEDTVNHQVDRKSSLGPNRFTSQCSSKGSRALTFKLRGSLSNE